MLEWFYELFNADIMKLYIPSLDHARMLRFNSHIYLPSKNTMFQYLYIFDYGCYISALEHVWRFILKNSCSSHMYKNNF